MVLYRQSARLLAAAGQSMWCSSYQHREQVRESATGCASRRHHVCGDRFQAPQCSYFQGLRPRPHEEGRLHHICQGVSLHTVSQQQMIATRSTAPQKFSRTSHAIFSKQAHTSMLQQYVTCKGHATWTHFYTGSMSNDVHACCFSMHETGLIVK